MTEPDTLSPVLVTGASGFVGRHLLELLGEEAVPTDVNVTDFAAVAAVIRETQPRALVHLAAMSGVADSWGEPAHTWEVNAVGTVNVLTGVRRDAPRARILVASTGEVYGRAEQLPTPEEAPVAPLSPYAASKAAAEVACAQAARTGTDVVVARSFQHEGPGRDERFALGSWARQLVDLEQIGGGTLRVGNLEVERDITDVRDVCRAYRLLLERTIPAGVYNVASGRAVRMAEVAELLATMARVPVAIEEDAARVRPAEIERACGDASRLRETTGWQPQIPLEQTLKDTLEAARESRVRV
jgi:GDP-4-dehydro-6-deoxy-D-mannose reductase